MPKVRTETISLILVLFLELLTNTECIPVDLQDAMTKASSLDTFMELLNASDANPVNSVDEVPMTINNEPCKPTEVLVQVTQPKRRRTLIFPVYVKLFRCRGGCNIEPRLSQCVATEKCKIPVKVGIVSWRKGDNSLSGLKKKVSTVHLLNETRCGCSCRKKRYCNPRTHVWNSNTCRCDCKLTKGSCRTPLVWNNYSCKCECPKSNHVCHGPGKVWNQKKCRCTCHDSQSCSPGYYMNPETCRCTCHRNWCQVVDAVRPEKRFDEDTIELAKLPEAL